MHDAESDRDCPVHGLCPSHKVSSESEKAVIGMPDAVKLVTMTVSSLPITDVDHPQSRDRESQNKQMQTGVIVNLSLLQVKTGAFPVSKAGFYPETLATSSPGMRVSR